jgi:hypothetical protein
MRQDERQLLAKGLRVLTARDRAVNRWLNKLVGPAYDAPEADPLRAVTAAKARARLASERKGKKGRGGAKGGGF